MLGQTKKYFTLIAQSVTRADVEKSATAYETAHPGVKVVIDHWKGFYDRPEDLGLWRARVWITIKRSWLQHFLYTLRR
jgi:hypothetical protein